MWYILAVCPGREIKVRRKIIDGGFKAEEFIVPDVDVDLKKANEKLYKQISKEIHERCKLLAGYFFLKIELTRDVYVRILELENIYCFLGEYMHNKGRVPRHVPEREMNRVKEFLKCEKIKTIQVKKIKYKIDDEVLIVSGYLENIQGRILEILGSNVRVMPSTFSSTSIIVPANVIEKCE